MYRKRSEERERCKCSAELTDKVGEELIVVGTSGSAGDGLVIIGEHSPVATISYGDGEVDGQAEQHRMIRTSSSLLSLIARSGRRLEGCPTQSQPHSSSVLPVTHHSGSSSPSLSPSLSLSVDCSQ